MFALFFALMAIAATPQPPAQGPPPRDTKPSSPAGSAMVRGRVLASDTGRPLRRARVMMSGYQIQGLPPGDYLAVALDYVEDGAWNEAEYLDSIRRLGQRLTLSDAESRSVTLKPVTP